MCIVIRVLHFNSNISKNSGVLSVIMNYYRSINRDKIQFDFLYFDDLIPSYTEDICSLGGRVYRIVPPHHMITFRKRLKCFLNEHQNEFDILHIHDPIFTKFIYGIAKKSGIKKVIVHSHATMYSDSRIGAVRNKLLCHKLSSCADELFACSDVAGQFLFKKEEFYLLNNAIWMEKFAFSESKREEIRTRLKLDDCLVLGHVGAFRNQKNHTFLLDIFKAATSIEKNIKLLLVGDGPLIDEMKGKARSLGILGDVIFLGKREDVNELYQAMDVFVLPSIFEGLPMVGIEAQCADLPIVMATTITREAGIGDFQFLNLSDSPDIWAETAIQLAVAKKGRRSRKVISEKLKNSGFEINTESKKLEEKYSGLIEG